MRFAIPSLLGVYHWRGRNCLQLTAKSNVKSDIEKKRRNGPAKLLFTCIEPHQRERNVFWKNC